MRKLKISGLLVLLTMSVASCDLLFDLFNTQSESAPECIIYNLALSFQDASGKDLVKGIELQDYATVNLNSYVLDIVVSKTNVRSSKLGMQRYNNGYCYLTNYCALPVSDCPQERILTYRLQCPYIFGDNDVHYIVTYWDIPKDKKGGDKYAKCTLIEFEGNEITGHIDEDEWNYVAIIILNN